MRFFGLKCNLAKLCGSKYKFKKMKVCSKEESSSIREKEGRKERKERKEKRRKEKTFRAKVEQGDM